MKKRSTDQKYGFRKITYVISAALLLTVPYSSGVQAEENVGYLQEDVTLTDSSSSEIIVIGDSASELIVTDEPLTGTYTMEDSWVTDDAQCTEEKTVYKQADRLEQEETSVITCSYLDTNYSVMEYEQLRDMLTNNLLYSNVNAQISTSAAYTTDKDYLYILIVDDSSQNYRSIYHYVVGDYRCFLVEVKEDRTEAEQARAKEQKTPQEVGQSVAEEFVWNTQW